MARIIDVRHAGGDLAIIGNSLGLPVSNAVVGDPPPLDGALRYNPDDQEVQVCISGTWVAAGLAMDSGVTLASLSDSDDTYVASNTVVVAAAEDEVEYRAPGQMVVKPVPLGDYILELEDAGSFLYCDTAIPYLLTIPLNSTVAFPVGTTVTVAQGGSAAMEFASEGEGLDIIYEASKQPFTAGENAVVQLIKVATNTWHLLGALLDA